MRSFLRMRKGDMRAVLALAFIAVVCAVVLVVVKKNGDGANAETDTATPSQQANVKDGNPASVASCESVLHSFDPNEVDSLTLISFGLKPYQVRNFLHYRAAGAVFSSAESMGRTYGWTEDDVQRLAPYVRIGERYRKHGSSYGSYARRDEYGDGVDGRRNDGGDYHGSNDNAGAERSNYERVEKFASKRKLDVNLVDSATLRKVPGVGEKICAAILRQRERLGGFVDVSQLLEVSIVSPELLEWFTVTPSAVSIKKVNVNTASFQRLNSHPYISYEQTRSLIQYRRLYGKVQDENSLISTGIFSAEDVEKLRPYLEY